MNVSFQAYCFMACKKKKKNVFEYRIPEILYPAFNILIFQAFQKLFKNLSAVAKKKLMYNLSECY